MRIPLAANLESRDGTLDQDAIVKNGIIESRGADLPPRLRKRPGTSSLGTVDADNTSQGAWYWPAAGKFFCVKDDTIYSSSPSTFSATGVALTYITGDKQLSFAASPAESSSSLIYAMLKSNTDAVRITYRLSDGIISAITEITDTEYPDDTLTPDRLTVPGIVVLDGYFIVMTTDGELFNSALEDCINWAALDFTTAAREPSPGTGIARLGSYVVAFKEWSSDVYYNAGNPTGSILSPVSSGFAQIGCPDGWSIATVAGTLFFIGQTEQDGRGVYMMQGLERRRVSTPDIDRVLALDTLAAVYAYAIQVAGNILYILTLTNTAVTLVYNVSSGTWTQWTSLEAAASKTVSSITRSGTTATVNTSSAHGMSDGDPVVITGADQGGYNGYFQISYVDSDTFTTQVDSGTVSPATGTITAYPLTETYFKLTHYAFCDGYHIAMHLTDGDAYKFDIAVFRDDGNPINFFARTTRLDGGTTERKKLARIGVIGTDVSDTAMIRWSDDDSGTFSAYRSVNLGDEVPELRRCGAFSRRSIEFRHVGNTAPVIDALELDIGR